MTVPNVADFDVIAYDTGSLCLQCPQCRTQWYLDVTWPQLRDLIGAASEHARTAHAMSEQPATTAAWTR